MMLLKQHFPFSIYALLIICTLAKRCYQQTTTSTKTFNKEITFCIQNHTMSTTLQTFWHNANADCELESKRLIELYSQLLDRKNDLEDQCTVLLKHQMRKKLIQFISVQLEESFILRSIEANTELKENLKKLQLIDKKTAQIICQRAINEVYLLVEPKEIINEIMLLGEEDIQIVAFQSLFNKYLQLNDDYSATIIPRLVYHCRSLLISKSTSISFVTGLKRLYNRLPKVLRDLYEGSYRSIALLNYHHSEYLYAPRDSGPYEEQRLAMTWFGSKDATNPDIHLLPRFNNKGSVSFASNFGASPKYLYAELGRMSPFFWIDSGLKFSLWWQVLWDHESELVNGDDYIKLQNEETKDLLCANDKYDNSSRSVAMLNAKENISNPACFWLVTIFSSSISIWERVLGR